MKHVSIGRFEVADVESAIGDALEQVVGYYRIREGNSLELTDQEINLGKQTIFEARVPHPAD